MRFKILKSIIFLSIVCVLFVSLGEIFKNKAGADVLYTYREESANSLDVLFIGASTGYRFFSPMELWQDYGIASYNLGTSEQSLQESLWVLKYALNNQTPKLVIMDVTSSIRIAEPLSDARTHLILDNLPINETWMDACCELVPKENRLEYMCPLLAYHERWKELKQNDFKEIQSSSNGTVYNYVVEAFNLIEVDCEVANVDLPENALRYLEEMVDICKEHGCELLFTINPVPYSSAETESGKVMQGRYRTFVEWAEKHECSILNMLGESEDIGLDMSKDYSDLWHVNVAGTMKITKYLGNYLVSNYEIPNRHQEKAYVGWADEFDVYVKEIIDKINSSKATEEEKAYFLSVFMANKNVDGGI